MNYYFPVDPATLVALEASDKNWDWPESAEAEDARLCRELDARERREAVKAARAARDERNVA